MNKRQRAEKAEHQHFIEKGCISINVFAVTSGGDVLSAKAYGDEGQNLWSCPALGSGAHGLKLNDTNIFTTKKAAESRLVFNLYQAIAIASHQLTKAEPALADFTEDE